MTSSPQDLVHAVTSIEDRRFFDHGGVDYIRLLGAVKNDLTAPAHLHGRRLDADHAACARILPHSRKADQAQAHRDRHHLSSSRAASGKQQIFQMYANEIPLGQQEASRSTASARLRRPISAKMSGSLTLSECALLAGMIQSPSRLNPYRHPERAMARRNLVLDTMVETGSITEAQADAGPRPSRSGWRRRAVNAGEAPYFVDLVREELTQKLGEASFNREGLRVYTSLDPDLQRAATAGGGVRRQAGRRPGAETTQPQGQRRHGHH